MSVASGERELTRGEYVVEHPEAGRCNGGALHHERDDSYGHVRQWHHRQQPIKLSGLRLSIPEPCPERLLLKDDRESLAALIDHPLALHADGYGVIEIVGCFEEVDPQRKHGG